MVPSTHPSSDARPNKDTDSVVTFCSIYLLDDISRDAAGIGCKSF